MKNNRIIVSHHGTALEIKISPEQGRELGALTERPERVAGHEVGPGTHGAEEDGDQGQDVDGHTSDRHGRQGVGAAVERASAEHKGDHE